MKNIDQIWPKKITVDKRIVELLSVSTYQNFPKALKEIIINSYDADATSVQIEVDEKNERIEIVDNGLGIDEEDFDFYLRIAFKTREKIRQQTIGRKIVGKFGVGFLSIFPFCLRYEIESTKKGSDEILYANIPTEKYFTSDRQLIDISNILIPGGVKKVKSLFDKQYTKVKLSGFSEITKEFFSIRKTEHTYSIFGYSGIQKLIWQFSDDLPLNYENEKFNRLVYQDAEPKFDVTVNGIKLFREIFGKTILSHNKSDFEQIGDIKFKYFISTDFRPIQPPEARGLKIRNLNVGVGARTFWGIGIEGRTYASQSNLTGEVLVLDGLNDLITLNREDFNYSADFEKLKKFLRLKITRSANTLDDLSDIAKVSRQTEDEYKLLTLDFLDPKKLKRKLEILEKKGFKIKFYQQDKVFKKIEVNKKRKTIEVHGNIEGGTKKIKLSKKVFKLGLAKWDYDNSETPACKIVGDKIIINEIYPLFQGRKYLDVFFKIHALLLINFKKGIISKEQYRKLINQILDFFNIYIK